jgi:hypothetical protein
MQFKELLNNLAGFFEGFLANYGTGKLELDLFLFAYLIFFVVISSVIIMLICSEFKKLSAGIDDQSLERIDLMIRALEIKVSNLERNYESDRVYFSQEVEYLYIEQARLDYSIKNIIGKKNSSSKLYAN